MVWQQTCRRPCKGLVATRYRCWLLVFFFLDAQADGVSTRRNGLSTSDLTIADGEGRKTHEVKTVAILRACHFGNCPKCPDGAGWGLDGKDWGCCGSYNGCCHLASTLCYVHDALCRCCRLGLFFCGPFCNPDPDCVPHRSKSKTDTQSSSATQNKGRQADKHYLRLKATSSVVKFKRTNNVVPFQQHQQQQSKASRSSAARDHSIHRQVASMGFGMSEADSESEVMTSGSHALVEYKNSAIFAAGSTEEGSGE